MKKVIVFSFIIALLASIFLIVFLTGNNEKSHQSDSMENLKALPYLTWVPAGKDIQKSGVIRYDHRRAYSGINLFNSRNLSRAYLMDMQGRILHTWEAKINEDDSWQHVELCEKGDLLAIVKDRMLVRLDWNSNIRWYQHLRLHHDVAVAENGDIYTLVREEESFSVSGYSIPILNEYVVVLSSEGEIKKKVSLFDIFKEEIRPGKFVEIRRWMNDSRNLKELERRRENNDFQFTSREPQNVIHINTVEILDRNIDKIGRKGNLLVCALKLDLVGIIDLENQKLVWKWGPGNLSQPHHPTFLENGHILIFDNGVERRYSRVVELDPSRKKIVWEYQSDPPQQFYSVSRGSSQRLPNGNTLITDSDKGYVFEATFGGEIVWEFFNPEIRIEDDKRAAIYRMTRIIDFKKYPFLESLE
ncbi:MAG: hypothetical protein GTO17_12845 [Candidatus Aminicenantes bacterium]|nr:hypothetical protein [Candidatus Aminicenantes bacterium]